MGQCYTVEAKLKFRNNDPAAFCEAIRSEIEKRDGKSAYFYLDSYGYDLASPFDCFRAMTASDAEIMDDGTYSAGFDASYGWEGLMIEVFSKAAWELEEGSYISIWPDFGQDLIEVRHGKVVVL